MSISVHNLGESAISKALEQFESPTSDLFLKIRTSLKDIERDYFNIKNSLIQRAKNRKLKEEVSKEKNLLEAKKSLKRAIDHLNLIKESNQKEIIPLAENLVKFAEGEIVLVESISRLNSTLINRENKIDEDLWNWYDQLISILVEALEDDSKFQTTIQFLTGGALMIGGMASSTVIGDIAGVLAAIQLAQNTLKNLKGFSSLDEKMKRYELGLQLLYVGKNLSEKWAKTLFIEE